MGRSRPAKRQVKAKANRVRQSAGPGGSRKRSGPGQLDRLVLAYMKRQGGRLPLSPSAVAHGINAPPGAVGNCLSRRETAEKVRAGRQETAPLHPARQRQLATTENKAAPGGAVTPTEGLTRRRNNGLRVSTSPNRRHLCWVMR